MNNYNQLIIKRDILLNILARCYLIGDNDSYERIQQMIINKPEYTDFQKDLTKLLKILYANKPLMKKDFHNNSKIHGDEAFALQFILFMIDLYLLKCAFPFIKRIIKTSSFNTIIIIEIYDVEQIFTLESGEIKLSKVLSNTYITRNEKIFDGNPNSLFALKIPNMKNNVHVDEKKDFEQYLNNI